LLVKLSNGHGKQLKESHGSSCIKCVCQVFELPSDL